MVKPKLPNDLELVVKESTNDISNQTLPKDTFFKGKSSRIESLCPVTKCIKSIVSKQKSIIFGFFWNQSGKENVYKMMANP